MVYKIRCFDFQKGPSVHCNVKKLDISKFIYDFHNIKLSFPIKTEGSIFYVCTIFSKIFFRLFPSS